MQKCSCGEKALVMLELMGEEARPVCRDCKNYWQSLSYRYEDQYQPKFHDLPPLS